MMSVSNSLKYHFLWVLYFVFVAVAVVLHKGEPIFAASGPYALGKPLVWLVYLAFLAYSIWVSSKESFFKALQRMGSILWCRQVGIDLYLGVAFFSFLIYLNEGTLVVLLLWAVPMLIFANLATLLYLALNYQSIVANFLS
jgi:hypothetical protein